MSDGTLIKGLRLVYVIGLHLMLGLLLLFGFIFFVYFCVGAQPFLFIHVILVQFFPQRKLLFVLCRWEAQ